MVANMSVEKPKEVSYKVRIDFVPVGEKYQKKDIQEEYVSTSPRRVLDKVKELRNLGLNPVVSRLEIYWPAKKNEERDIFVRELEEIAGERQSFSE